MKLTRAERAAIETIGRHRKTDVKVGAGRPVSISTRVFNQLQKKGLVMWMSEERKVVMLTAPGERIWTKMHPTSKYKIS